MAGSNQQGTRARRRLTPGLARRDWRGPDALAARLVHAALVIAFFGTWLTAPWEGLRSWHVAFGHAVAGAWLLRVGWSFARPAASLGRWGHTLLRTGRRLRSPGVGALGPATVSLLGLSGLVCAMLVLVPACFVSGWALGRLVEPGAGSLGLHRWLGTALMGVVAAHVALVVVLGVLRGRSVARGGLPGERERQSGDPDKMRR